MIVFEHVKIKTKHFLLTKSILINQKVNLINNIFTCYNLESHSKTNNNPRTNQGIVNYTREVFITFATKACNRKFLHEHHKKMSKLTNFQHASEVVKKNTLDITSRVAKQLN